MTSAFAKMQPTDYLPFHNRIATHVKNQTMKILTRTLGLAALLLMTAPLLFGGEARAQQADTPRIGYTNQEAILANMPDMQQVQQTLEQEAQTMQQEMQSEQQELQEMVAEYQQQQALLSDERQSEREQQLRQRQQQLQQSAQERQQQLAEREAELMEPLLDQLQTALNEVAQEQNLDVILRTQALLYVDEQRVVDITPEVAERLGIDVSGAETGPTVEDVVPPNDPNSGGGQ